jgi:hypothetical protein
VSVDIQHMGGMAKTGSAARSALSARGGNRSRFAALSLLRNSVQLNRYEQQS